MDGLLDLGLAPDRGLQRRQGLVLVAEGVEAVGLDLGQACGRELGADPVETFAGEDQGLGRRLQLLGRPDDEVVIRLDRRRLGPGGQGGDPDGAIVGTLPGPASGGGQRLLGLRLARLDNLLDDTTLLDVRRVLVLLSPALLIVLLVGVFGIGVMAAVRVLGWSMAQVRAGTGSIATGPIPRRPTTRSRRPAPRASEGQPSQGFHS